METLIYGFRKRYSLPVLLNLFYRKELTFDQIYEISTEYSETRTSKASISRAVSELLEKGYLKKDARLLNGKAFITYALPEDVRKMLNRCLRKDA